MREHELPASTQGPGSHRRSGAASASRPPTKSKTSDDVNHQNDAPPRQSAPARSRWWRVNAAPLRSLPSNGSISVWLAHVLSLLDDAYAAFQVAMGRTAEARALVDEAQKSDPDIAAACVADGLMFDREGKRAEAKAAYEKAVDLGTTSAYAYHRAAVLNWRGGAEPDQATLARMQKSRPCGGSESIGRAVLRRSGGAPFSEGFRVNPPAHRESDHDRSVRAVAPADRGARAVETQQSVTRARSGRRRSGLLSTTRTRGRKRSTCSRRCRPTAAPPPSPRQPLHLPLPPRRGIRTRSFRHVNTGDAEACGRLAPFVEKACAAGDPRACHTLPVLQWRGLGVPKDEARGFATLERLCSGFNDGREDSRRNCRADPANQHICPVQRIWSAGDGRDRLTAWHPKGAHPTTLSQRGGRIDVLVVPAAHAQRPGRTDRDE
jgi:hypothetical protein